MEALMNGRQALLKGLGETLYLTIVGIICATIFGVILGLLGILPNKFAQGLSTTIIYIFRGSGGFHLTLVNGFDPTFNKSGSVGTFI